MAVTNRKQREREQRRTMIIDAAEKLFYARGFDNVTMDEIAKEAEFSKGSLYVYFKNKDSLFFAIVDRMEKKSLAQLMERMKKPATGGDKLRDLIQWYLDTSRENGPAFNEMVSTYAPLIWSRMDPDDNRTLEANTGAFYELLNEIIRDGMADGSVRTDLNPVMLGFYLNMITMSIVWPLPAWKAAITRVGIPFDDFLENFSRFIDPVIDPCPDTSGGPKPGATGMR